jgi:murein endopeptidase
MWRGKIPPHRAPKLRVTLSVTWRVTIQSPQRGGAPRGASMADQSSRARVAPACKPVLCQSSIQAHRHALRSIPCPLIRHNRHNHYNTHIRIPSL